jgi:hypothetical protein
MQHLLSLHDVNQIALQHAVDVNHQSPRFSTPHEEFRRGEIQ